MEVSGEGRREGEEGRKGRWRGGKGEERRKEDGIYSYLVDGTR